MRTNALLAALVFVVVGITVSDAEARSRHERVKVEAIKKSGKIVGLRLKLTLRPQDYGHDRVKIGLAPTGGIAKAGKKGNFRDFASNKKKGFLFHQWKEVTGLKTGKPKEVTLEVLYSKNKKLPIGEKVEVVTAWRSGAKATYYHVWGMKSNISGRVTSYKVPGTKPKAAAAASSSSTTTRTRRTKPKPKPKPKGTAATTTTRRKKPKPKPKGTAATTTTRRKKPKPKPKPKGTAATTTTRRKKPKPKPKPKGTAATTTTRRKKPKPKGTAAASSTRASSSSSTTTRTRRKKPKPKPKGTAASTRQNLQNASASSTRSRSRASSTTGSTRARSTSSRSRSRSRTSRAR